MKDRTIKRDTNIFLLVIFYCLLLILGIRTVGQRTVGQRIVGQTPLQRRNKWETLGNILNFLQAKYLWIHKIFL